MSHLVSSVIFQEENVSRSNLSQSYRFVSLSDHLKKEDQPASFLKGKPPKCITRRCFDVVAELHGFVFK